MDMILASASPRRKRSSRTSSPHFSVCPAAGEEAPDLNLPPEGIVQALARQKAEEVFAPLSPHRWCWGRIPSSGTKGRLLGKPKDAEDAARMLRSPVGEDRTASTQAGACAGRASTAAAAALSEVEFYPLSEEFIREYIAGGSPLDKAGAYGIQGRCPPRPRLPRQLYQHRRPARRRAAGAAGGIGGDRMMHLAVDLGTSFTKIYLAGSGIVLAEPSCLVLAAGTGRVLAVRQRGAEPAFGSRELLTVVRPVLEGEIADEEAAAAMLSHFLRKVGIPPAAAHGMEALLSVHCGASDESLARFRRVAEKSGIGIAPLCRSAHARRLRAGAGAGRRAPRICGGDRRAAAPISRRCRARGIRQGVGLTLGSENLDAGIIAAVSEKLGVRLRRQEAARLKEDGRLPLHRRQRLPSPVAGYAGERPLHGHRARGRHCRARTVCLPTGWCSISAWCCKSCTQEEASFMLARGIRLSGGGARLTGLADYFSAALGTRAQLSDRPQYAVIAGAGRAIENADILRLVCLEE